MRPGPGRPRKRWNPADLLAAIEAGALVDAAAAQLGITRRTIARYACERPDFRTQLDAARRSRDARIRAELERMRVTTRQLMAGEPLTG
jgi:hypothetical protein